MINWHRIAFWAKQPVFNDFGADVHARAARLKRMHEEFGTVPSKLATDGRNYCESRSVLRQMYDEKEIENEDYYRPSHFIKLN